MSHAKPDEEAIDLFVDRLTELIEPGKQGLTADEAGMSRETLNRWLRGKARPNPRLDLVANMAAALKVSPAWLISDEVDREGKIQPSPTTEIDGKHFTAPPLVHGKLAAGHGTIYEDPGDKSGYAFKATFLERLAKGPPQPGRFVLARLASESHIGGSMAPGIRPGALLLVDRGPDPRGDHDFLPRLNGEVFFIDLPGDGGQTCKRAYLDGDQLLLTSDAPGYDPIRVDMDGHRMRDIVIGRVRWVGQEMG